MTSMEKRYLGIALALENLQEGATPPIINKCKNVSCARKDKAKMQMLFFLKDVIRNKSQ